VRNLWLKQDPGTTRGEPITRELEPHDVILVLLRPIR
jgi:hypothetical protein